MVNRYRFPGLLAALWLGSCATPEQTSDAGRATSPSGATVQEKYHLARRRPVEKYRREKPAKTPAWVKKIPDHLAEALVEKHLYKEGPVWGLARRNPYQEPPYEEVGSFTFYNFVKKYNLWDKVPPLDAEARSKALAFWQSWQDPATGQFKDPRDPHRMVNEKYVFWQIAALGGKPLYPQKSTRQMAATDAEGKIDTRIFLERTQNDPDWDQGGWGVGSHTGLMAGQILRAINAGQTELIGALEKGLEQILSHQDPASGLWGPPNAPLAGRLGGALKVILRLYSQMGIIVPHTRELADTLIRYEKNGDWYRHGAGFCVPQNVLILVAYCLEVSDYRRGDLLDVVESKAREYQEWVLPDGRLLIRRGDPSSIGLESVHLQALGLIGSLLHWEDCPLENVFTWKPGSADFTALRYRPAILEDGSVKIIDTRYP